MSEDICPPQCQLCHKLISYADLGKAVVWGPYGTAADEEPPPDEYAHATCWEKAEPDRISTIEAISWSKPYVRGEA